MRRKVSGLEEAIGLLAEKFSMPELNDLLQKGDEDADTVIDVQTSPHDNGSESTLSNAMPSSWEVIMDPESGPAAIPASCVSTVPQTEAPSLLPTGDRSRQDLITRAIISLDTAESLYRVYKEKLDHLLYGILKDHESFASIRASSPLLTAAVCTIGALHSSSPEFKACYDEFISLSTAQVFSKKNTADEVRALCIGAFWLSDVSWTLVGIGKQVYRMLNQCTKRSRSCAHCDRDSTPSLYQQNASRQLEMLPPYSYVVPRLYL
jgi:hypothetical protein